MSLDLFDQNTFLLHVSSSYIFSLLSGGAKTLVEAHRHDGVFIARGKEDVLVTRNLVPGESIYGEKRMEVEVSCINFIASNINLQAV